MNKYLLILGALVVLGVAYYGISPLFRNVKLDEQIPVENPTTQNEEVSEKETSTAPAPIVDTPAHPASGTVRIVSSESKNYLRYENFKTINGPDLYIYLSKDTEAKEFINLGRIKATEGNINYEIPSNVDPEEYPYALVWCKAFGVLFNSAKLY